MSEEEKKKAEELAQAEAARKAEEEAKAKESEQEGADKAKEKEIEEIKKQHEEQLKEEREKREKAEKDLAREAYKHRKGKDDKDDDEEEEEEEPEDKPVTVKQLKGILSQHTQEIQRSTQGEAIIEKVSRITSTPEEKELVLETHRNRTWPSWMSIDEQLEESLLIANKKRILAQNSELKRALLNKDTKSNSDFSPHQEGGTKQEPNTPSDNQALKASGMIWDSKKGVWKKPIMGGKMFLFYDPKSKKRWKGK